MNAPRIRLCQMQCRDGDLRFNLARVLELIADSVGQADLLVFPETCLHGFPTPANIAALALPLSDPVVLELCAAVRTAALSIVIGWAENDAGRFFNSAVLIDETGAIRLRYRKSHLYLSDQGVFEPGSEFPVCSWHGVQLGILICFDIEFPEAARMLAQNGADLIVLADGNMDFSAGVHRQLIPVRALENQLFVLMANRVGPGDKYHFAGASQAADPFGNCLAMAGSQAEERVDLTLDLGALARARAALPYLALARLECRFPEGQASAPPAPEPPWSSH